MGEARGRGSNSRQGGVGWLSRIESRQWLIGVGTFLLVVLVLLAPLRPAEAAPQERHLTVTAHGFAFEPGTVRVNRGDTVVITLDATDVVHGIYIDGYGLSTEAEPGRTGSLSFVADRAGAFRFRCSVACGSLHPFMIGKLVVEPNLPWGRAVAATVMTAAGALAFFWTDHRRSSTGTQGPARGD
jgi:heme/copper-type cytochrome/quinol oxidase subunit 2